ncbi:hypothetical protein [Aminobacter phage Erebus]|nr:hypothetical protein [Aminobacter phage Erebus]
MKSSAYSMKNVAVTVDGQAVLGLWDGDDAVSIEPLDDAGAMLVGADGSSIFSQSANEGATITVRLQHTSPAHRLLHQRWARQRARGVRIVGFPISVIDVDSGEGGSTDQAFIQRGPTDQKGKNAVNREWVLVTGQWRPEVPKP